MVVLASSLISKVKNRVSIPEQQFRFTDADLLEFMQTSLEEVVYPWLFGINEEFFIITDTIEAASGGETIMPNKVLPFPTRAYGRNLREIKYIDTNDNKMNVPLINLDDQELFQRTNSSAFRPTGAPSVYIHGDEIRMIADATTVLGEFQLSYALRPPTLVNSTTQYASITNVAYDSGTTTFTVVCGADFTTYLADTNPDAAKLLDIYRKTSGAYVKVNVFGTRTASTTITTTDLTEDEANNLAMYQTGGFSSTTTESAEVDLVFVPADQNCFTTIPRELESMLMLATGGLYLEAVGDIEGLQVVEAKIKKAEAAASKALARRVTGECKIINNNRGIRSWFGGLGFRRW